MNSGKVCALSESKNTERIQKNNMLPTATFSCFFFFISTALLFTISVNWHGNSLHTTSYILLMSFHERSGALEFFNLSPNEAMAVAKERGIG